MFNKILIANRGEIACRIIKTARKLGVHTVAVYSDADAKSLHVSMADEAVNIGPAPSRESYLVIEHIIDAAKKTGAEAIHPGYGFLSENAEFCQACEKNNVVFIGPPVSAIEAMGSKSAAKNIMDSASVPLVPGYHGDDQNPEIIRAAAEKMGYPVLLKAAAGGGGKGMRQVWSAEEFDQALAAAKREAINGFGDDTMLVEKYLTQPRHVEIQVFCDQHGNAVYLAERDCSLQRRHQKVIEEAPAPGLSHALRSAMGEAAIRCAQAINYQGAGTVEFLLDVDNAFYFMEMNTRLQVEHPVTEMITGQDLVEWQLRVASGEPLPLKQEQISVHGHAFEARIYAEDPDNDFLPVTGTLSFLQPPTASDHVRIDTGVLQGDEVSVFYDPMIAKLVVWDEDRDKALRRFCKALREYRISGTTTNLDFLYNLASSKPFQQAQLDTGFIEKHHQHITHDTPQDIEQGIVLAALYRVLQQEQQANQLAASSNDPHSPWKNNNSWRLNEPHCHTLTLTLFDKDYVVDIEKNTSNDARYIISTPEISVQVSGNLEGQTLYADIDGYRLKADIAEHDDSYSLYTQNCVLTFSEKKADLGQQDKEQTAGALSAPMNGTIVTLLADIDTPLAEGDPLLVMEAMKMEHTIRAPASGRAIEFYYQPGDLVDGGAELLNFKINDN